MAVLLIAPVGALASEIFVSNTGTNTISPFSIGAGGAPAPITCTSPSCNAGNSPNGVAVSPNGQFLYATNFNSNNISPFRINADGTLTPIACAGTSCNAGTNPYGIAVSPNGQFLYAVNYGSNKISPFRINANGTLTPIACAGASCNAGTNPQGIAVSPNGQFLYVVNGGSTTISPFRINVDGTVTPIACSGTSCKTGAIPVDVAVSPNGQFLYAVNSGSNNISPFRINADGTLAPTACAGSSCDTGAIPGGIAVSPNGQFLYATNFNSNNISPFRINADGTLTPIACAGTSCNAGTNPYGIAVSPNGQFLYAANYGSNNMSPFRISTDGSLTPIACAGTSCNAGTNPAFQSVATSPDQAPSAAFGSTAAITGQPTAFDASASTAAAGQVVARYDWDFGDGQSASNGGVAPTHAYSSPGTYTVTLTVTDDAGCSTTQTFTGQTVSCNGGPVARISHQVTIAAPTHALTVLKAGNGSGAVRSSPVGIDCGKACAHAFDAGTAVTLRATPGSGSTFAGWGGACSGTGACRLTMGADHDVSARFAAIPPNTKISKATIDQANKGATFKFKALGGSKAKATSGFQCTLVKKKHAKPKFRGCTSPKTYRHLKPHKYTFEVRAFDPAGKDKTPAKKKFKIK